MKDLIDRLIVIIQAAIAANSESTPFIAKSVKKGFSENLEAYPEEKLPLISVDDGGERVDDISSSTTQHRIYSVLFEVMVFTYDEEKSLDNVLDISNQIKTEIELEANRQLNGHVWAISTTPFSSPGDNGGFWRGRRLVVDFIELEDRVYNPF